MRTVVSTSFFGFVTLAAVCLAGCSFDTAGEPTATTNQGPVGNSSVELAPVEPGPAAKIPARPTATGVAPIGLGSSATDSKALLGTELNSPATHPMTGFSGVPTAIGVAELEPGPMANVPGEPGALGQACSSDAECGTGSCADGVCCDTACDGVCEACNVPGQVGFCVAHAAGTDPEQECAAPTCVKGVEESFACDGSGACQPQSNSCGSYACGDSACRTECRSNADCASNAACVGGRCESQ
ncbi:MAG: hypothetical protein IPI67_17490 [Myxococcales bacterium]|nr:hypothetical protein [Myxococcales bacterium]